MAVPAATPPIQHGGHLDATRQNLQAWLHSANSGTTHFATTRWWQSCWKWWVIDVTHFDQRQRINGGSEFMRTAGTVALYRPNLRFEEWQKKGGLAQESWVLFRASGQMLRALHDLTGKGGYCHFQDPEAVAPSRIMQISRELFYRRSGFQWHAQAAFLDLLALLVTSKPIAPRLHVIRTNQDLPAGGDLQAKTEKFIRSRISDTLSVEDLARHAGLGLSTFAHTYRKLSGESPYRSIIRLKLEAAKRLLLQERLSVKETAARLGYSSEFQLSRCFKRMEGRSPSAHVRAMTEKGGPNPNGTGRRK